MWFIYDTASILEGATGGMRGVVGGVSPVDRLEALMFAALQLGEEVNTGFCRWRTNTHTHTHANNTLTL